MSVVEHDGPAGGETFSLSAARIRQPLLSLTDLVVGFGDGAAAVDGVSFTLGAGECLGLVGESGSGKSVTCLSLMGLLPPRAQVRGGAAVFDGKRLFDLEPRARAALRGREIAMVFQDPLGALNPVHTVGWQIAEALMLNQGLSARQARAGAVDLMARVGIPEPRRRAKSYPHQMSGGMNQRVMIAIAIAARPKLLIADEPTTALDVTIQAQILDLLDDLRRELDMALLLITHDLGVVAQMAERVAVMRHGKVVETGSVDATFHAPQHPYTRALLGAVPRLDRRIARLATLPEAQELRAS
ncbi:ABC transporter ATP-binding protein [Pelagibius sp. 7325]|uniref:ABC transporter ATP-binding protein n=1 Tax=Pelagibius sp. 7325 TaxID=3131994 RepID=UPI0030EC3B08